MRRALVLALVVLFWAPSVHADHTGYSGYVKAARYLNSWRYEDARRIIEKLSKKRPKAPETVYLRAELAFLEGDYDTTLELLDGLADTDVYQNVGPLRDLAASTYETTKGFAKRPSRGGHFVIYYPPGKDEVIVDLAGDVLERAYKVLGDDFGLRPSRPVRVELLSKPGDLARVSTLTEKDIETTGTIALCKYNKLMVVTPRATVFGYPWMDTLTHEFVHYLVSTISHDRVPVWLHEGLAKFEQVRWRREADGTLEPIDEHLLAGALKKNKLISFDDMHPSMAKLPSQEAAALAFAEVFTMVAYVHHTVGYHGLREVLALIRKGKGARRAVAEVMGTGWPQVEKGWKRHLRAERLETSAAAVARAGSRIRFKKGNSEDENVGLDQVSSQKARAFTRLGGILRARGMSQAAAVEYKKALDIVGPKDPFVAAKLSRTYLELGKFKGAIELAKPLAEADEQNTAAATTLGVAYMELGDAALSRASFEQALRMTPFDPTVRCGLAQAYESLGDVRAERERTACEKLRR